MGIGRDSPSSCTDGDLATTRGATLEIDINIQIKHQYSIGTVFFLIWITDKYRHIKSLAKSFMDSQEKSLFIK